MKTPRFLPFLGWLLLAIHPSLRAAKTSVDAGGVSLVLPDEKKIAAGTSLSVSFPAAMIAENQIDLAGLPCPLTFSPAVPGDWLWKSQTDGQFTVRGPVLPGQEYAVTLTPGLHSLAGAAVTPPGWGTALHTEAFEVSSDWADGDASLKATPAVVLKFTYPVRLQDAAGHIYFQDRDSHARQPADLALREEDRDDEEAEAQVLSASPRAPLPPGHTWDLVVEDVREQGTGAPTSYLKRIALGTTAPLELAWLGAFNLPLEKPLIRARFDDSLDPATVTKDAVRLEPAVPNLKVHADGEDIIVEGDFDRTKHYQLTVQPTVHGRTGFGLAAPLTRGATFRPKKSAIFFPSGDIRQRALLGLRFSFLQAHTGALRWRLASVPLEKFALVQSRLREFGPSKKNPVSGNLEVDDADQEVPQPTQLLVDTFGLPVRGEGTVPASQDEAESLRELRWTPPGGAGVAPGAYLLEVDGPCWDGKGIVGNRSLIFFSETVLTEKRAPDTVLARLAGMADGRPRPGVAVRALSQSNFEVARATTDRDGIARFTNADLTPPTGERGGESARTLVADTPEGPAVSTLDGDSLDNTATPEPPKTPPAPVVTRGFVLTDRSLYRPGQTIHIKGLIRLADTADGDGGDKPLRVPAGRKVTWSATRSESEEPLAGGETTLDAEGGWSADWALPADLKLAEYAIDCTLGGDKTKDDAKQTDTADDTDQDDGSDTIQAATVRVQDYKVPLFEVAAQDAPGGAGKPQAACRVRADYFSGQPVVGAKVAWRVHWDRRDYLTRSQPYEEGVEDDNPADSAPAFQLDDTQSEHAKANSGDEATPPETRGEAKLDAHGAAELIAPPPPNLPGARYTARWEVAVTSADGQSVAAANPPESTVMLQGVLLGVSLATVDPGLTGNPPLPADTVRVRAGAFGADDRPVRTGGVKVEVFHVGNKTVRENVAPFVTRYHNVPRYESVFTKTLPAINPETVSIDVPVKDKGRYVAVLTAPGLRPVSAEEFMSGTREADTGDEVPVQTETSLVLRSEKPDYAPGETAAFLTRTPVTGTAWVSVETDHVIDSLLLPLPANTTRLEIPVKPAYAPNARVAVYLLRPGGNDRLPAERFATAALRVRRPDRTLDVRPSVAAARVRPGGEIRAEVRVASEGKPVPGADVTLWAVDDAILALGDWHAPKLLDAFYPERAHKVKTYAALHDYVETFTRKSLYEKGFIIGGGGEEFGAKFVRKDFQPLAFWKTNLKTDADGKVAVRFAAPDNLTRYRVVAVAQSRAGQFGEGEGSVEVAKPLSVEPSLPRFLRAGDDVELRAVVRQSERDRAELFAACRTDAGFVLQNGGHDLTAAPAPADRDAPATFRFVGKVPDDGRTSAKIAFRAGTTDNAADLTDAVEITLPILPPTILRRESTVGTGRPGGDVAELLPADARGPGAVGRYDVTLSTSGDLPRLQALPEVLEYPHGCFEQITSRILVYCAAHDLFAGLPANADADGTRRRVVEHALALCVRGLLPDDMLPYWSDKTGNAFVTAQADWAASLAASAGFRVDEELQGKLDRATRRVAADGNASPFVRAYALFAEASRLSAPARTDEEDADDKSDADSKGKTAAAAFDEKAAQAVFLHREVLGDDGRALLAVALHRAKVMPQETTQLLREILPLAKGSRPVPKRAFDAPSFGSTGRTEALALWACAEIRPPEWQPADLAAARTRLGKLLDAAPENSTQENLWALLAFNTLRKAEHAPKLRVAKARPAPTLFSPDGTAAAWTGLTLGGSTPLFRPPPDLAPSAAAVLSCVLSAEYRVGKAEEDQRRDRGGLRVERVVRNLTDPKRTGRAGEPPVQVNDRLLVRYRLQTPKPRFYVALEDELPAGLEAVNPDLPLFAPFYDLPPTSPGDHEAALCSSELHDHVTNLYFDQLDPGVSTSGILVRATTAGTFRWPATQAGPMYEPTVSGLAPSQEVTVVSE